MDKYVSIDLNQLLDIRSERDAAVLEAKRLQFEMGEFKRNCQEEYQTYKEQCYRAAEEKVLNMEKFMKNLYENRIQELQTRLEELSNLV